MKVLRASEMGMCFGVRDALTVARSVQQPAEVTIHGELVHNQVVNDELGAAGFHLASEAERSGVPGTPTVLITAHGVSDRERARLEGHGLRLIDTTCPLVRFAHERARELAADGRFVVVLGRSGHVEVEGLAGDLDHFVVIENETQIHDFSAARIGVVAQTTTRPETAELLLAAIRRANPGSDVIFADTICGPTRNRQKAMVDLLAAVEAVVVVGGRGSNNTRELVRFAEARGTPSCLVEGPEDLDLDWLSRFQIVGLSAGTSSLPETVDAVEGALLNIVSEATSVGLPREPCAALEIPAGRAATSGAQRIA